MADYTNHQSNIEQARELLSSYIDEEVSSEERLFVEQELAGSPELRRDLETLRQTVALLADLPQVSAPRPFTLTEADVQQPVPGKSGGYFGLPNWFRGLAVLAATLVCVVAVGAFLLSQQFGRGSMEAPAEIASAPSGLPTQSSEAQALEAAPAEEPLEEAESEMMAAEPADEEATMAASEADTATLDNGGMQEAAPAEEEAAMPAPAAEEAEPPAGGEAARGAPSPTPAPMATAAPPGPVATATEALPTASGQETTEEMALASEAGEETEQPEEEPAMAAQAGEETAEQQPEEPTMPAEVMEDTEQPEEGPAMAAQSAATEVGQEEPAEKALAPRLVEIQNLDVQVEPGLLQIEGTIPAPSGSQLTAQLLRNGEPFDDWADPATLQTEAQPGGNFSFTIRTAEDRTETDLSILEPATYEVTIASVGEGEPVEATVFFDTFGPADDQAPAASPTPSPAPTAAAQQPPASPSPTLASPSTAEESSWPVGVGLVLLLGGLLVAVGLVVWFIARSKN